MNSSSVVDLDLRIRFVEKRLRIFINLFFLTQQIIFYYKPIKNINSNEKKKYYDFFMYLR